MKSSQYATKIKFRLGKNISLFQKQKILLLLAGEGGTWRVGDQLVTKSCIKTAQHNQFLFFRTKKIFVNDKKSYECQK